MKFKQQISGEFGEVSLDLTRELSEKEAGFLTHVLVALVNGLPFRPNHNDEEERNLNEYRLKFMQNIQSGKINAIKVIRQATGYGLKEAKDMVESTMDIPWMDFHGHQHFLKLLSEAKITEFLIESRSIRR